MCDVDFALMELPVGDEFSGKDRRKERTVLRLRPHFSVLPTFSFNIILSCLLSHSRLYLGSYLEISLPRANFHIICTWSDKIILYIL